MLSMNSTMVDTSRTRRPAIHRQCYKLMSSIAHDPCLSLCIAAHPTSLKHLTRACSFIPPPISSMIGTPTTFKMTSLTKLA
jgi:hypothetical protein